MNHKCCSDSPSIIEMYHRTDQDEILRWMTPSCNLLLHDKTTTAESKWPDLHDVVGGPEDAVPVEVLGRVEPESVPLFPPAVSAPVPVHIRLKPPFPPPYVS